MFLLLQPLCPVQWNAGLIIYISSINNSHALSIHSMTSVECQSMWFSSLALGFCYEELLMCLFSSFRWCMMTIVFNQPEKERHIWLHKTHFLSLCRCLIYSSRPRITRTKRAFVGSKQSSSSVNGTAARAFTFLRRKCNGWNPEERDNGSENEAELVNEREERAREKDCERQGGCWTLGPRWTWRVRQGFDVGSDYGAMTASKQQWTGKNKSPRRSPERFYLRSAIFIFFPPVSADRWWWERAWTPQVMQLTT